MRPTGCQPPDPCISSATMAKKLPRNAFRESASIAHQGGPSVPGASGAPGAPGSPGGAGGCLVVPGGARPGWCRVVPGHGKCDSHCALHTA